MTRGDDVVAEAIAAARVLGAATAREAAEITKGRALTDDEWEQYRSTWDRQWLSSRPPSAKPGADGKSRPVFYWLGVAAILLTAIAIKALI